MAEVVPQGAPPDDQRKSKDLKRLEGLLRTLFEQRPVWSTVALRANVPSELASKVKRCAAAISLARKKQISNTFVCLRAWRGVACVSQGAVGGGVPFQERAVAQDVGALRLRPAPAHRRSRVRLPIFPPPPIFPHRPSD